MNLGLGQNVSNFNYSLTPELMNVTGNGSFCVPQVSLAMANLTVKDGDLATIQVVTSGKSGNALYNVSFFLSMLLCGVLDSWSGGL